MNAGATTDLVAVTLAIQVLEVGRREREVGTEEVGEQKRAPVESTQRRA